MSGNQYSKGRRVVMFSDARVALEKEVRDNHPKLAMKILIASKESDSDDDMAQGITIGIIAAEFNMAMDGLYSFEQIEHLYDLLYAKLVSSRSSISDVITRQ